MGAVSLRRLWHGMVRVVNVEKALYGARYLGSGSFTIAIEDKQIPQNNKTFEVTFADGKCASVIADSLAQPDIRMGINEFSRLIIGTCDVQSLPYMDNVTVLNPNAPLQQVFYKKPNMIAEYF